MFDCRGLLDPSDSGKASSQSGETSSFPDTGILHAAERSPLASWLVSDWPKVPCGTANGEPASTTDEKPTPASAGLTDQVAWNLPSQPSSLVEVGERPGGQPRDLPDLSFIKKIRGRTCLPTPIRNRCQWDLYFLFRNAREHNTCHHTLMSLCETNPSHDVF